MAGEEFPANPANNNDAAVANQPEGQVQPVVQNQVDEQQPYERKKRKKTSAAWAEFKEVVVAGEDKLECIYCSQRMKKMDSGCTSHLLRHLQRCTRKPKANGKGQQHLNLENTDSVLAVQDFKYNHAKVRELMAHFIIVHEQPFAAIEYEVLNKLLKACTPHYKRICRTTATNDVFETYKIFKGKIKFLLEGVNRMSLTTDLWKSNQTVQYMVLTCHFVDKDWMLQKRVLNFCHVKPPHTGLVVSDALHACLVDWDIVGKVWTITVDNASYNDCAVKNLKGILSYQGALPLGGEMFHIRCAAHILNLLVQSGLKEIQEIVNDVRESVKHIAASEIRIAMFRDIAKQLQLPTKKLILDCSTRWNSTYHMISTALELKDVFPRYKERDSLYHSLPTENAWENVGNVCESLELFNDVTTMISGSDYPTANLFLPELCDIKILLKQTLESSHASMRSLAWRMLQKFDKYWGEANLVVSLAAVLDPRNKFKMLELYFLDLYTLDDYGKHLDFVRDKLYKLFHEYVDNFRAGIEVASAASEGQATSSTSTSTGGSRKRSGRARFDSMVRNVNVASTMKSELDIYLEEGLYEHTEKSAFDIIGWWKEQKVRFKVLPRMACDIMAIPVTSVASEATFSAGGRVIDPQRASLGEKTVEALLCSHDWLRAHHGLKGDSEAMTKKEEVIEIDLS